MNYVQKFFGHLKTVTKHRRMVRKLCFKCGLYWQGLTHDLSKYSPTEFWNGVKFYTGTKSPHLGEREKYGYSKAWLHHKGRNKHHAEYWQDIQSIFKPANTIIRRDGTVRNFDAYNEIQNHIKEQLNNNQAEVFIQHYKDTYDSPENPPSWMCVEIMYFNHLSKICTSLKNRSDVTGIANHFGLPPEKFCSWLHTINYVRNLCAHHSRLWNRELKIVPERLDFSRTKVWISNPNSVQRSKIYHFLCMLNYMLQSVNPSSTFTSRLKALLNKYSKVSKSAMGFPQNWENEDIWKNCIL